MHSKRAPNLTPPAQAIAGDPLGTLVLPEPTPDYGVVTSGLASTPADQALLDSWIERGGFSAEEAAEAKNG